MKIKIAMTFDIDPDAWREEMLADPDAPASEVRRDVRSWISAELGFSLGDRGLLVQPPADVEVGRQSDG